MQCEFSKGVDLEFQATDKTKQNTILRLATLKNIIRDIGDSPLTVAAAFLM